MRGMECPENRYSARRRQIAALFGLFTVTVAPFFIFESSLIARLVSIASICLLLWLFELVPAFLPTLVLWALIPLTLSPLDQQYSLSNTLRWAADPVLALFFGGFALGAAAERCGVSSRLAIRAITKFGKSFDQTLAMAMILTAFVSMWISNIAAAALMFGGLRPFVGRLESDNVFRRTLLIGIAFAANLGGMATPVGTGPNAIAIAAVSNSTKITFVDWMIFALPLTAGLLFLTFPILRWRAKRGNVAWGDLTVIVDHVPTGGPSAIDPQNGQFRFLFILVVCVIFWLTEPIHGVPAAVVAISSAAALFFFRVLTADDIKRIDWSTLMLIAGGITLGRLIESSGLVHAAVSNFGTQGHPKLIIFALCFGCALLSALMSNTATVVMLLPIATAIVPYPSTAILIAVSASFGMMFAISTPPNAMAHGEGSRSSDMFYPGLIIMLVGSILVSLTGQAVLNLAGIP